MKCVILCAGLDERLESELRADTSGKYKHLVMVPKALLPDAYGNTLLDNWWELIRSSQSRDQFDGVFLVTNAEKFKHFDRWTNGNAFPRTNLINDGTTAKTGGLGSLADFDLVLRCKDLYDEDVMVVSGDMLCNPKRFDLTGVSNFFKAKCDEGDVACYYEMSPEDLPSQRGVVVVDPVSKKITSFREKPAATKSKLASIVFNVFRKESLGMVRQYLKKFPESRDRSFGKFMEWYVPQQTVFGMKLPDRFELIGAIGLKEYELSLTAIEVSKRHQAVDPIVCRTYARVGVLGNPSDGFFGKTISLSIQNFWAQVTIKESEKLELLRHPLNDPTTFGSLADLHAVSVAEAYLGGLRLMQATCKMFYEFCSEKGIAIARKNFTIGYDTNIPRQVGLAGSSAIVTSTFKALMAFFKLTENDIPKDIQPNFVLKVETEELRINAGLQDRVIQIYNGLVYMDFDETLLTTRGHGVYEPLLPKELPPFYLAYLADPSDSGQIHNNVRNRFDAGDQEAREGMKKFANIAERGKTAFAQGDVAALADLMDENFALRRKLYTDPAIGAANIQMIETAQKYNAAAKFSGSGGAAIMLCRDPSKLDDLKEDLERIGVVFVRIIPNMTVPSTTV
eukprot:m.178400 g.178400  ORF g.178400 m.178400 type:complete len:622 (-) comp31938_c0_seq1:184-2049(-)